MQDFSSIETFLLIVGNSRSGSSLLGSMVDAHHQAAIANESSESKMIWRDIRKEEFFDSLFMNAEASRVNERYSGGYTYGFSDVRIKNYSSLKVIGDKIWNPATLLLHGDNRLINNLSELLGVKIRLIHALRNPFDVIATMTKKSGATIRDRTIWYFMHLEAINGIEDRLDLESLIHVYHENMINLPAENLFEICNFLDIDYSDEYLNVCSKKLFLEPDSFFFFNTESFSL